MNSIVSAASLAAATKVVAPSIVKAATATDDSDLIFAAIEEHRRSYDDVAGTALHAFSEVEGRVGVGNEENPEWQAADLAKDETSAAAFEALDELLETTPTTPAGARALLDWLTLNLDRGNEWPMLRSPEVFKLLKDSFLQFA